MPLQPFPSTQNPLKWVFTGPESSGKTTRATQLHQQLPGSALVEEYARPYLNRFPEGYAYTRQDVLHIAAGQARHEWLAAATRPAVVICDTDLLTIHIWMQVKYGHAPHWLWHALRQSPADQYFLCSPDLPWEPDPLREAPDPAARWQLFDLYHTALQQLERPFTVVNGS